MHVALQLLEQRRHLGGFARDELLRELEPDRERDQVLLDAVVERALEASPVLELAHTSLHTTSVPRLPGTRAFPAAVGGADGPGRPRAVVEETRRDLERRHKPLVVIDELEATVHYLVALLLLAIAAIVLYRAVERLVEGRHDFASQVTTGINDLLLVIILMELLRTVVGHLDSNDFQLRPFLIVGIITAVRHILAVGARLTLIGEGTSEQFRRSQLELGVSSGVVLALAVSFFLVSRIDSETS